MQLRVNKLFILITVLIIMFSIFIYFLNYKHSYTLEYKINNYDIKEEYHKDKDYYIFQVSNDLYNIQVIGNGYINKRYLINNIINNGECLEFDSKVKLYDLCMNSDGIYYNLNDKNSEVKSEYKDIKIYDLDNSKFLLWNYNEFIYLSEDKNTSIKLFSNDIYNLNLIYQTEDYLLVPDYNNKYKFEKIYLINSKNGKVSSFKLRYEVYFDSYFLGDYKDKVYLFDNKNELEYYFDLKKKDINIGKYQVLSDGKWLEVTKEKLKNNKLSFDNESNFTYKITNNSLYGNDYLVDKDVDGIISTNNFSVYYLKNDTLYYFDPYDGRKTLLKYSEWNFNNNNMIFVFHK